VSVPKKRRLVNIARHLKNKKSCLKIAKRLMGAFIFARNEKVGCLIAAFSHYSREAFRKIRGLLPKG